VTTVPMFNVVQVSRLSWCYSEVWKATCRSVCNYAAVSHVYFASCRVWDVNDGSIVNTLPHHGDAVRCLKFNSDTLVTGSAVLCVFVPIYIHVLLKLKTGYEVFAATYFKREVPINPHQYHM